jgi:hypothetical protein
VARQQSQDFCAAGFDTLVRQCGLCINTGGGYVEIKILLPGSNISCSTCCIFLRPIY